MDNPSDVFVLRNGQGLPCLSFGTYEFPDNDTLEHAVADALTRGFRHLDTATIYGTEKIVARAVAQSNLSREDVCITTKLWNEDRGYERTMSACERSLSALNADYIDLYLVHWPSKRDMDDEEWKDSMNDTWRALEELYENGSVRAIGVSNFKPHHLEMLNCRIAPMVNQIEFHPGLLQKDTIDYCAAHDIQVSAWGVFGFGKLLRNASLLDVAGVYGKSVAQILIRWCLQHDVLPVVRSMNPKHIALDLDVFSFALSPEDMHRIDALVPYVNGPRIDPDRASF